MTVTEHGETWYQVWAGPVAMEDDRQGWMPHINWCTERWGNKGSLIEHNGAGSRIFRGETWYFAGQGWFDFEREQDAVLFSLKWS